jgi:O-antigen chain-terminating methyltransferase
VNGIRDRVRARYPEGEAKGIGVALPDLLPILHAKDAAEAKVASIGSVNPRPPGPLNGLIQSAKQNVSRALGWFVRDQVEFNRSVLVAVEATLESLNEVNRTFTAVGERLDALDKKIGESTGALQAEASELKDIRSHWVRWREEWEKKLFQNEVHFLRSLSDLQASNQAHAVALDSSYRESVRAQHAEFTGEVSRALEHVHERFWADLQKIRLEYESLIHNELRVIRQKAFASSTIAAPTRIAAAESPLEIDYARFADRFRGSEEYVRERQKFYLPWFSGRSNVLDIGCGRGEFLELMRESGVQARGVDLDDESVALCRSKGLEARAADVFEFLAGEPDSSFDGIFAAQVIEHMAPEKVPQLVRLCGAKLKPNGVLALETPNPECLAIFATHFYLDPTHTRPIPPGLLVFYYEEAGFGGIDVHRLAPAVESMPSLNELPAAFREAFFGGLDYSVIGRRL